MAKSMEDMRVTMEMLMEQNKDNYSEGSHRNNKNYEEPLSQEDFLKSNHHNLDFYQ